MSTDSARSTAAARRWSEQLEAWAIPDEIRAAAISFPYEMDPDLFRPRVSEASGTVSAGSLSSERALEVLAPGRQSTVIDIGCGGGAATMVIADRLHTAIGVDQSVAMLDVFAEEAKARGVENAVRALPPRSDQRAIIWWDTV